MTREMNEPEERLAAALQELAASSRQGASSELGLLLKDSFRRHHARHRRLLRVRIGLLSACVMAAGILVLLWASLLKNKSGETAGVHTIPPQELVDPPEVSVSRMKPPATRRRVPASANAVSASNTFVALPSLDVVPPGDELRVVRLEMPGEDLRLIGAPITEEIVRRRVTADFVIGHDGTPYAMRLVRSKF
jgi:hypothetical protein